MLNKQEIFQRFVSDSRLGTVIESLKRSNDIFDIIKPSENQHSEILKWLFNPREGHGQGDTILKDFLIAAYWSAASNVYSNKIFLSIGLRVVLRARAFILFLLIVSIG